MTDQDKTPEQESRLVAAYNRMAGRIRQGVERAEQGARPALAHLIEAAKDKAIRLEELTVEEAEAIAGYLKRDLQDAAEYLAGDEARELADWLKFDLNLIEERLWELLLSGADQTRLAWLALERRAREATAYHSGEITGVGTLVCQQCGKEIHFHHAGHIPPCPGCKGSVFLRPE